MATMRQATKTLRMVNAEMKEEFNDKLVGTFSALMGTTEYRPLRQMTNGCVAHVFEFADRSKLAIWF